MQFNNWKVKKFKLNYLTIDILTMILNTAIDYVKLYFVNIIVL